VHRVTQSGVVLLCAWCMHGVTQSGEVPLFVVRACMVVTQSGVVPLCAWCMHGHAEW